MSVLLLPNSTLAATSTLAQLSPSFIWLLGGAILCLMELFVPTAFVELAMGISAFLVAIVAMVMPHFGLQVLLWMVFSLVLVFLTRRLLPKRQHPILQEATEAQTLTEIAPGKAGRVIFEGNSWQAKSECDRVIAPDETVIVVGRSGNTLFVLPES